MHGACWTSGHTYASMRTWHARSVARPTAPLVILCANVLNLTLTRRRVSRSEAFFSSVSSTYRLRASRALYEFRNAVSSSPIIMSSTQSFVGRGRVAMLLGVNNCTRQRQCQLWRAVWVSCTVGCREQKKHVGKTLNRSVLLPGQTYQTPWQQKLTGVCIFKACCAGRESQEGSDRKSWIVTNAEFSWADDWRVRGSEQRLESFAKLFTLEFQIEKNKTNLSSFPTSLESVVWVLYHLRMWTSSEQQR